MAERIEAEITDADFDLAKIKRLLAKSKSMQDRLRDAEWIDAIWKESGYKLTSLLRQETKWKSIGDTMINAAWIDALREETGYKLMTLLRQEPRLLTIKYCGCNVLHLAMRHNWYSLVLEILRKFEHLYKDASFLDRRISSRSEVEYPMEDDLHSMGLELASFRRVLKAIEHGGETSSRDHSSTVDSQATTGDLHSKDVYGLDLASFRDLLEAKDDGRVAMWSDVSGLDVFAMAVIQGDAAINTLLAEAVLQVDGLFDHPHLDKDVPHPYKDVVRFIGYELEETGDSNSSPDRHEEERGLLCEIIEKCFPVPDPIDVRSVHKLKTVSEQPHAASKVSTSEQQRATDSQVTPATSGPMQLEHQLADKIYPEWTQEWELTSRFLPLEEFLFLACFSISREYQVSPYDSSYGAYAYGSFDNDQSNHRHRLETKRIEMRQKMLEDKRIEMRQRMLEAFSNSGKGISFRKYLLGIKDTRGYAMHHMVRGGGYIWIQEILKGDVDEIANYINVHDSAGRTPLYIALALGHMTRASQLLKNKATIVDSLKDTSRKCGHWQFKGRVWQADVRAVSTVNHYSPDPVFHKLATHVLHVIIRSPHISNKYQSWLTSIYTEHFEGDLSISQVIKCPTFHSPVLTWLDWAAYVGDTTTLQILADDDKIYDPSRLNNLSLPPKDNRSTKYTSVLHAAAAAGDPHGIRTILATGKFDPLVQDRDGNTALHLATHFEAPLQFPHSLADFCEIPDRRIGTSYQVESSLSIEERMIESRRQGCINLLLQAGIDLWQTNRAKRMADPGPKASSEYTAWWYDKVSKETQEARTSLNAAANAISVTAALVVTASYVGPLQPPMGYSEGLITKMQVGVLSVRIFIVCNTLAFYLALAAIMLSLTPSLPMPQESILDELKLIRRTVTLTVGLLILSMVAILVAFASASIAVIPDEGSWNHGGLTVGTLGVGGSICILVLILCLFRLLRLAFHKRKGVRRFYNKYVCM